MAQKSHSDFTFLVFGANFSKNWIKNLVTVKPSPITSLWMTNTIMLN